MSDNFDPTKHMTKLQGKDYMEVAPRVAWFRSQHPKGKITTEFLAAGDYLITQATVYDNDGNLLAQGSATVRAWAKGGAPRDIEKAETAAIGRAMAFAGYGTLQAGEEINEGDHLADAPRQSSNGRKESEPIPQPVGSIIVDQCKYVDKKDGTGAILLYEHDDITVLDFSRDRLRKLGDKWQITVDQWQTSARDNAKAIKLLTPIRVSYETVFKDNGEVSYHRAVTIESAELAEAS